EGRQHSRHSDLRSEENRCTGGAGSATLPSADSPPSALGRQATVPSSSPSSSGGGGENGGLQRRTSRREGGEKSESREGRDPSSRRRTSSGRGGGGDGGGGGEAIKVEVPRFLYGTAWKKDRTEALVKQALQAGFIGIDTACQPKHYNEPGVGSGIQSFLKERNVPRHFLFIQTKFTPLDGQDRSKPLPYDARASLPNQIRQSIQ
ncbi:aldo keto reductase family oxidoreductase, partial [Cystoisospora suis]